MYALRCTRVHRKGGELHPMRGTIIRASDASPSRAA
jgi:hypothetical protein